MPAPNISFAKIVATPTSHAWSQAYNAGSLFLAVSLQSPDETETPLTEEGKKLLSAIEAEFFGLEEKSLTTIQDVLSKTLENLSKELTISLSLGYIKDDILYCFLKGTGVITLKRGDVRAPLLKGTSEDGLISASGRLQTDDLILLETAQFTTLVPEKTIKEAFEYPLPNDIAETITPHVHNSKEGGASAIILAFKGVPHPFPTDDVSDEEEQKEKLPDAIVPPRSEVPKASTPQSELSHEPTHAIEDIDESQSFLSRLPISLPSLQLNKQKKLILGILILLVVVLIGGIIMTKQNQQSQKELALYNEIYPQALKAYENGESLQSLNEPFARDDYKKARDLLRQLEGKLPEESKEAKNVADLNKKIEERLGNDDGGVTVPATKVTADTAPLLASWQKIKGAISGTETTDTSYILTGDEVISIDKQNEKEDTLITNDADWSDAQSIGVFGTNIYILDREQGLLKFVPTEEGYASSSYFSDTEPNLRDSLSLAIDGSVYILFKDGSISKYTRGEKDSFKVSGLETVLQKPTQLVTSPELDNLYLLDSGAGIVLQIDKNGSVLKVYTAKVLKNATAISLSEDETSVFVLQNDSLYSLSLK